MTPSQHATRPPVTTVQPWDSSRRVCKPTCPSGQTPAIVSLERSPHAGDPRLHRTAAATRELVHRGRRTYLASHRPATHNGRCAKGEPVVTCRATLTLMRLHTAAMSVRQPSSAALHACTHMEKRAEAAQHTTITQLSVAHLHETNLSCSSCAACHEHVAASHPRGQMRPGTQGRDPRTLSSMTSLSWVSATRFLAYFVS